jgi:hypothetical protein
VPFLCACYTFWPLAKDRNSVPIAWVIFEYCKWL